jgi:hypothetical protein
VQLSRRLTPVIIACIEVAAVGARILGAPDWFAWPARVVFPALGVALVPGAAAVLAILPDRTWPLTEFLVLACSISIALVQIMTIAAMTLHFSTTTTLAVLFLGSALILGMTALNPKKGAAVTCTAVEATFWVMVSALACLLYREGSPYSGGEDYLHLSVIRRLAMKSDPALDNIYFVPGIIYTYPFPGIHYLDALVSTLGGADPIFVYHKLRFLWGPVALASVCVVAGRVFQSPRIALASGFTALAFVISGTFASVPPLIWGQLVPYSHASDVALGVLLPLSLACLVMFLDSKEARETAFLFAGTLGLVVMETIVHIRELIQILVYLGAFTLYLLWVKAPRTRLVRPIAVLIAALVIGVVFTLWSNATITHIGSLVAERREQLVQRVFSLSLIDLLRPPLPILSDFVAFYTVTFWGWMPFLLIAAPFALRRYQDRWLVGLLASSTFCYLLIMRFPLVAFPYVYFTYFEILFTPLRNIVFFLYVAAGAVVYLVTERLAKASAAGSILLAVAVCSACGLLFRVPRTLFDRLHDILVLPAIALFAWVIVGARRRASSHEQHGGHHSPRSRSKRAVWGMVAGASATAAAVLVVVYQVTARPAPVVHVRWANDVSASSRAIHELLFHLTNGEWLEGRSWSYDVIDPSFRNVRALVTSSAVQDTHEINRETFQINATAPKSAPGVWFWSAVPLLGNPDVLALVVSALIGLTVLGVRRARRQPSQLHSAHGSTKDAPHPRPWLVPATVVGLAVVGWMPAQSVLTAAGGARNPADAIAALPCGQGPAQLAPFAPDDLKIVITPRLSCAPSLDVIEWVSRNVPVDAVFVANTENQYLPSAFLPQQFLGWYGLGRDFLSPELLFADYLRFYRQSLKSHGAQPFFNDRETNAERLAFVKALKVTHVLVDPPFHDVMLRALEGTAFQKVFDDKRWAVFRTPLGESTREVTRSAGSNGLRKVE